MGNPVVRFEIGCRERRKNAAFYEQVFGWSTVETPFTHEVDTGADEGINGAIQALGHEPHNYVMIYMQVPDADEATGRITEAGGEVIIGPRDIPADKGRFAWFKDPEGNLLGIFEPAAG